MISWFKLIAERVVSATTTSFGSKLINQVSKNYTAVIRNVKDLF